MSKKIDDPARLYKLISLTITSLLLMLCCLPIAYSAEKMKEDKSEIKNNVFNLYDRELGRVDKEGGIFNINGRTLGSVDKNGIIYNVSDLEIGKVEPDGSILNQSGTRLGSVNEDGDVFNISNRKLGSVKDVADIKLIGGAARLIFLK